MNWVKKLIILNILESIFDALHTYEILINMSTKKALQMEKISNKSVLTLS